ncbi:MAG: hypothetical protein HYV59_10275 [Planctomycetes bacterium]|nr:hypothetical protein [Planctomycetota bacterium]
MIDDKINDGLYAYIGGIIRELGGTLIEINAMPDLSIFIPICLKPFLFQNLWRL